MHDDFRPDPVPDDEAAGDDLDMILFLKHDLRILCRNWRIHHPHRSALSDLVAERLENWPAFRAAARVLFYVSVGSEVDTRRLLALQSARGQTIVVPRCEDGRLGLYRIESLSELAPGAFNIPEPNATVVGDASRRVDPHELDLILVPGLAFDDRGGRLGSGQGFYDRLLAEASPNCLTVGLAFECQMIGSAPMEPHDRRLHYVCTPHELVDCRRERA